MWNIENISVVNIMLDPENIRMNIQKTSQADLIHDLFMNEDAFSIASSIARNGLFPDELPIVISEGDNKYLVIEGNRRISAIKALLNPDLVPAYQQRIQALPEYKDKNVRAVVAPDRSAAQKLIANKHVTITRRSWKPLRQAYFYQSQLDNGITRESLKKAYPDHDIDKFLKMLEMHKLAKEIDYEQNIASIVFDERNFPITNLQRMYDDANIRKFFDFDFDKNGYVNSKVSKEQFLVNYKRLVEDVASNKIDSRKYNTREQRQDYIDKFGKVKLENQCKDAGFNSGKITAKPNKKQTDGVQPEKKKRSNRTQRGLIPSYVPYKLENSALKHLYDELRKVDVSEFPNATHDLFRSFLECSIAVALQETGQYKSEWQTWPKSPQLGELLSFVLSNNCNLIKDNNIKQIVHVIKSQYSDPASLMRMNMVNHNENWLSTEKDVRDLWSTVESVMKVLLNPKNK